MFAYRISLLLLPFLASVLSHKPHVALKFGDDLYSRLHSYIMINPDMSPLEEAMSVCSWVKQLSSTSSKGMWMHYKTQNYSAEIVLSDNLVWAYLQNSNTPHSQIPVQSQWYHVCLAWSFSSGTAMLYYNGVQIGSSNTSRKFSVSTGSLVIGQLHDTYKKEATFSSGYSFGGELTKLNILKRKVSDQEVEKMYKSGICSNYEDTLENDIHLSWETLLSNDTEKHGNILKMSLTCPDHTLEPTTEVPTTEVPTTEVPTTEVPTTEVPTTEVPTTAAPTEESKGGCNSRWAFLRLSDIYNKTTEKEMLKDLKNRWELLAEFDGHEIDDTLIAHLTKNHCSSEVSREDNETEESGDCSNRWAILRSPDFFENVITSEMIVDLRRRWDLLAEFTGHRIDNALIAHLIKHHCKTVE